METKLTLKLDTSTIKRAKQYISIHKGTSLSKLVEIYFNSLVAHNEEVKKNKLPPIVVSLSGILKKHAVKDYKNEYADYLAEKYK